MHRLAILFVMLPSVIPKPLGACTLFNPAGAEHVLDPDFSDDRNAPAPPSVRVSFHPSHTIDRGGCESESSCDGLRTAAYLSFDVATEDDRASLDEIGWSVSVVSGTAPDFETGGPNIVRGQPIRTDTERTFGLLVASNAPFDVTLAVRAVDLNGNLSEPTLVTTTHDCLSFGACP